MLGPAIHLEGTHHMSRFTTKVATATAIALVASLGLTGFAGSAAAAEDCTPATAPQNDDVLNQAPVLTNDSVRIIAGSVTTVKVLANDSDPDGDKLYVTSATTPKRGATCVNPNGTIEYFAAPGRYNRTDTFTYAVTDGDRYRTATVTVNVEGLKPMRPVLKQRLVKKGKKVSQRAVLTFTNPNSKRMILLAGDQRKGRPELQRVLYPGKSATLVTKTVRVYYVTALAPRDAGLTLVNDGLLNTRNGNLRGQYYGYYFDEEYESESRAFQDLWARRNG